MKTRFISFVMLFVLAAAALSFAQVQASQSSSSQGAQTPLPQASPSATEIAGLYSFLRDGEFVQLTVEDNDTVNGFISRYADAKEDKGAFVDYFFKSGSVKNSMVGWMLKFQTKTVHAVWFEFEGVVKRGPGKTPQNESYWVISGKLQRHDVGADGKDKIETRQVEFKSFPQDEP